MTDPGCDLDGPAPRRPRLRRAARWVGLAVEAWVTGGASIGIRWGRGVRDQQMNHPKNEFERIAAESERRAGRHT